MAEVSRIRLCEGGPEFSRLVFGLWRLREWQLSTRDLQELLEGCLELGITTFDHADIYGGYTCEALFGDLLQQAPDLKRRMELVTKCGIQLESANRPGTRIHHYDTSSQHILRSVDNSLSSLAAEQLDLLLIHRPDPLMDADEISEAFSELKDSGKVKHFGVSNFTAHQFDLVSSRLPFPLVTNQVEISPMRLDTMFDGTLNHCQRLKIAPMAWSPLAGGRLFTGDDEQSVRVREALRRVGEQLGGYTLDQVALAWLIRHPANILPVLGSGRLERIQSAAKALELDMNRQQWFDILTASMGHDIP
ncbi:MAG: aldo/keto reductase [Endozoicomonas sp.]